MSDAPHRAGGLSALLLLLAVTAACARPDPAVVQLREDRRAIAAVLEAYGEAVARGRVERLDSLFAPEGVQLFANHEPAEGREEILRWWEGVVGQRAPGDGPLRARTRVVEIDVAGVRAYALGSFVERRTAAAEARTERTDTGGDSAWATPLPVADTLLGAEPVELRRFKFLAILVREPGSEGGWRILRHSLSPDGRYRLP